MSSDEARATLSARGIPLDEERLFRAIHAGDRDAVRLLLAAGVRVAARGPKGDPAVVVAAREGRHEIVADLIAAGADAGDLSRAVTERLRRRDGWDRLGSLSGVMTFTSSLLIAALGWYFTHSYNQRQSRAQELQNQQQNRLTELQTIERMIPHLTKDEQSKRAALIVIQALATPSLAIEIGSAFGGTGAVDVLGSMAGEGGDVGRQAVAGLASIASRGTAAERAAVESALGRVFADTRDSVVGIIVNGGRRCTGFVVGSSPTTVVTAAYCLPQDEPVRSIAVAARSQEFAATLAARDASAGTVLLRVPALSVPALPLAPRLPEVGTHVLLVGAAQGEPKAYVGETTAINVDSSAPGVPGFSAKGLVSVRFDPATAEGRGGSGGGPILDANGRVVCMVYMGTPDMQLCVPAMRLRADSATD